MNQYSISHILSNQFSTLSRLTYLPTLLSSACISRPPTSGETLRIASDPSLGLESDKPPTKKVAQSIDESNQTIPRSIHRHECENKKAPNNRAYPALGKFAHRRPVSWGPSSKAQSQWPLNRPRGYTTGSPPGHARTLPFPPFHHSSRLCMQDPIGEVRFCTYPVLLEAQKTTCSVAKKSRPLVVVRPHPVGHVTYAQKFGVGNSAGGAVACEAPLLPVFHDLFCKGVVARIYRCVPWKRHVHCDGVLSPYVLSRLQVRLLCR
ncbi:hypothetical protein F5Y18DRAFT_152923 [Xylariaceae sp. FL1019]|nr:hypothetical protein F5Y18DRAFT_152923 [Xylariaceae sp. FL1019]